MKKSPIESYEMFGGLVNHLTADLRQEQRQSLCSDLDVVYEGDNSVVPVHPPDLSSRGMFINTPRHFPVGSVLKVRFRLNASGRLVNARSEGRYCVPGVGVGVEFLAISPEDQSAIETALNR